MAPRNNLDNFLHWQHSTAFVHYVNYPLSVPKILESSYKPFATDRGISVTPTTLPFFPMGSDVIPNSMPCLRWSATAYSIVKQHLPFEEPFLPSYDTPLWHSTLFRNGYSQAA